MKNWWWCVYMCCMLRGRDVEGGSQKWIQGRKLYIFQVSF